MAASFQASKGTFDVLPGRARANERVLNRAAELFSRAGYGRIETPIFEDTDLFARSVGESTDIVRKQMFSFEDAGGRSVTLRPEGTAPVCRAYLEHGMHKLGQPVKLWHAGPFFRYEAPQAGRFRQFTQVGCEAIGSDSPLVDAELIVLLHDLLHELEVPGLTLRLSSLGSSDARAAYLDELREYLRKNEKGLSKDVRERIDLNPLRAFDSSDEGTRAVMEKAPTMLERLKDEDADHFGTVQAELDRAGVAYELDGSLVRGLDYYTRTVFEFESDRLGAQSGIGGGGRYDGLVERLGGPQTPAAGWAAGIDRIVLALGEEDEAVPTLNAFVAATADSDRERALHLVLELRRTGLSADLDLAGRGLKGQLKHADRLGARHTVILDGEGAQLRDMSSGDQREVGLSEIAEMLRIG
jgi:histidyl-tRNA synthetase